MIKPPVSSTAYLHLCDHEYFLVVKLDDEEGTEVGRVRSPEQNHEGGHREREKLQVVLDAIGANTAAVAEMADLVAGISREDAPPELTIDGPPVVGKNAAITHKLPIFVGVPVIKTEEAPLVSEEGLPVEYSIRKTEHGEEIIVHPSKWKQFCEAAEMAGELLKGRNN